jgi:hypothetical protein
VDSRSLFSILYLPTMSSVLPSCLNPLAPEFVPSAHKKACKVVTHFITANVEALSYFLASVVDGDTIVLPKDASNDDWVAALREYTDRPSTDIPAFKTEDGRMAFEDFVLTIEFYVPLTAQPPEGYVNLRRLRNRIGRLLRENELCYSGVVALTSSYDVNTKMLILQGVIEECE